MKILIMITPSPRMRNRLDGQCFWILVGIIVLIASAVSCYYWVKLSTWAGVADSLITVLGIVLGAILIRIMRPFPITNPDSFVDIEEINHLEKDCLAIVSRFSMGLIVAIEFFLILLFLIANKSNGTDIKNILDQYPEGNLMSALLGLIMTLVLFLFPIYFVYHDRKIIKKQANGVRHQFQRNAQG